MIKVTDMCSDVTDIACTYRFKFAETNKHLKIIVDQVCSYKDADGLSVEELRSNVLEAVLFDKDTLELSNYEVLVTLCNINSYWGSQAEREENHNKLFEQLTELNNGFSKNNVVCDNLQDFVKRLVYFRNKRLFIVGGKLMEHATMRLVNYLDDLDNIEKLCLTINPETVINQINSGTLQLFDGGKKLKSIIGLPLDVVAKIDEYYGATMHSFQNYVKRGGSVEEIRTLFDWLEALKKLKRKRKVCINVEVDSNALYYIAKLLDMGCSLTDIMNVVTKEILMYRNGGEIDLEAILRTALDALSMQRKMDNNDTDIVQNIRKWHYIISRNFKILKDSRQDAYGAAVEKINVNSRIVDGWLIKCPTTERELFNIGARYNNCLPLYRDKIIDTNAIIYSMYPVNDDGEITNPMPPVTFEVTAGLDFVQIKTFNDADVTDEAIISVLKKWRTQIRQGRKETANGSC